MFEDPERAKGYRDLDREGKEVDALTERLKVRFGRTHDVVVAFEAANEAALAAYRAAGLYKIEPRGDSPVAVQQRAKLAKETGARSTSSASSSTLAAMSSSTPRRLSPVPNSRSRLATTTSPRRNALRLG